MVQKYGRLSLDERKEIYRLHAGGKSNKFIANILGRPPSTVGRELTRNSRRSTNWRGGYCPLRADELAKGRHARGRTYKLERQPELRKVVMDQLAMVRSPEQIAGRLAREQGSPVISHESIYRYIYWRVSSFKENLHRLLPRQKYYRGWGRRTGRSSKNYITARVSVHQRPKAVQQRTSPGHWEADLMQFSRYGQVLVVYERKSRFTVVLPQATRKAEDVVENLKRFFKTLPPSERLSVTFDNGSEFSLHYQLRDDLGMQTWFCDTHSPWQKGGVENTAGRIRRFLPRTTDPTTLTKGVLAMLTKRLNNTPRKCLGFKTPNEAFLTTGVAL
jgi:IS30 family transposase